MAYKHGGRLQEISEVQNTHSLQASPPHTATYRILQEEHEEKTCSLQEQLVERDQFIARLQDALRSEREKSAKLQSRFNQQGAELRRREQHVNRMREKLSQFTDRHKNRGVSIEILNTLPKGSGRRAAVADGRKEEALKLLLERREAELREAMKLRHSLTTLLHSLRSDMQQTLQDNVDTEEEVTEVDTNWLVQSEQSLGDHVTGGVFLEWVNLLKRLKELQTQSPAAVRTDQEKLLVQLEEELKQSRDLVRVQQQLLQDNVSSPLPDALTDSYYLEEWERLQDQWLELKRQRRSFQQERQAFTEAAIRLGHERCMFEQQKAAILKQQFLSTSPITTKISISNRRESTALGELRLAVPDGLPFSPCAPITPSSEGSEGTPSSGQNMVMTPSTPELYSALQLNYYCRSVAAPQCLSFEKEPQRSVLNPDHRNMDDWNF
ncbi:afadin- and alpha-actinin-binding protein B [Hoplias malabaricus]|uniref:afadin- and alpha-actinin-binding protein B n=1 Tax=Hoplias malabaricus TaxID=27720 RepID=UPI003462AF4C